MAGKKIKDLAIKETPNDTDVFIVEDGEATKQISLPNLLKRAMEFTPKGVTNATTSYAQSTSGTTTPTTWSGTMPAPIPGEFLWVRLTFTFSDASEEKKYIVTRHGADGKVDDTTSILFTEATTRANISSGEKIGIMLGKIRKFFADLKDGAFSSVVNNSTTTSSGTVLDGRMGKTLQDNINNIDVKSKTVAFSQASSRTNLSTGETLATLFGKVMKYFADLGNAAFSTVTNLLNETRTGYVLDARQGKVLKELIDTTNNDLSQSIVSVLGALNATPEIVANTNGQAMKFPGGLMICTKTVTVSSGTQTSWGTGFTTGKLSPGAWAQAFSAQPFFSLTQISSSSFMTSEANDEGTSMTQAPGCYGVSPANVTSRSVRLWSIAIGKWK